MHGETEYDGGFETIETTVGTLPIKSSRTTNDSEYMVLIREVDGLEDQPPTLPEIPPTHRPNEKFSTLYVTVKSISVYDQPDGNVVGQLQQEDYIYARPDSLTVTKELDPDIALLIYTTSWMEHEQGWSKNSVVEDDRDDGRSKYFNMVALHDNGDTNQTQEFETLDENEYHIYSVNTGSRVTIHSEQNVEYEQISVYLAGETFGILPDSYIVLNGHIWGRHQVGWAPLGRFSEERQTYAFYAERVDARQDSILYEIYEADRNLNITSEPDDRKASEIGTLKEGEHVYVRPDDEQTIDRGIHRSSEVFQHVVKHERGWTTKQVDYEPGESYISLRLVGFEYRSSEIESQPTNQPPEPERKSTNESYEIFISYSRHNKPFAKNLLGRLTDNGYMWMDWEDIPLSADWWAEITTAIESAETFIFIISPTSVRSTVCYKEIDHAVKNNKRIVPILHIDVVEESDREKEHPTIKDLHWLMFRETDDFEKSLNELITVLSTDLEHVHKHTQYFVRANEWDENSRENSYLLTGIEMDIAEHWLKEADQKQKDPAPTKLQVDYIRASREQQESPLRRLGRRLFGRRNDDS
jgi:hypothetical protein